MDMIMDDVLAQFVSIGDMHVQMGGSGVGV